MRSPVPRRRGGPWPSRLSSLPVASISPRAVRSSGAAFTPMRASASLTSCARLSLSARLYSSVPRGSVRPVSVTRVVASSSRTRRRGRWRAVASVVSTYSLKSKYTGSSVHCAFTGGRAVAGAALALACVALAAFAALRRRTRTACTLRRCTTVPAGHCAVVGARSRHRRRRSQRPALHLPLGAIAVAAALLALPVHAEFLLVTVLVVVALRILGRAAGGERQRRAPPRSQRWRRSHAAKLDPSSRCVNLPRTSSSGAVA